MAKATRPVPQQSIRDLVSGYVHHGMSMDLRHAQMIGDFISALPPCEVFEVGCCHGVSTAEILSSAKAPVTLCDYPRFQANVMSMIELSPHKVSISTAEGASYLSQYAEDNGQAPDGAVIVLDGDHRWSVMECEISLIRRLGFTRVILHDVANPSGDCEGPAKALTELQKGGFFVAVDQQSRPGERTDRGLAICCLNADDHRVALEAVCGRS